jgi:hypothetical protein
LARGRLSRGPGRMAMIEMEIDDFDIEGRKQAEFYLM